MKEVVGGFGRDVVKNDKSTIMDNGAEGITQQGTGDCIGDGFGGGQRGVEEI